MTTVPQPGSEATGLTCVYDAWNRLVSVTSGSTELAAYSYDGLNRLIETQSDFVDGDAQAVTHDYYAGDQLLETRDAIGAGGREVTGDSLLPHYQYVWSARAENAPVLRDTYSGGALVPSDRHLLPDRRQRQRHRRHRLVGQRAGAVCLRRLRERDVLCGQLVERFADVFAFDKQHVVVCRHAAQRADRPGL